jgi:hypothetical protein
VQASGSGLIIDFDDFVHFYRVVSGAECAQLIVATFVGAVGDVGAVGPGNSTELLGPLQIFGTCVAFGQHPARAFVQNFVEFRLFQAKPSKNGLISSTVSGDDRIRTPQLMS